MSGTKKWYRDFWSVTWQDINRRKDRYRSELFMSLTTIYSLHGYSPEECRQKALRDLEEIDQTLARDAEIDAAFWSEEK